MDAEVKHCVYCHREYTQLNGELFENHWFCCTTCRITWQIKRNDELMRQRREALQKVYQSDP